MSTYQYIKISKYKNALLVGFLFILSACWSSVWAGDFVLSPAKIEVSLAPGQGTVEDLLITNRLGRTMNFKVAVEDAAGSPTGEEPAKLLGKEIGFYSLSDFLLPAEKEFTLEDGQSKTLLVEIALPDSVEPGGLYGAVLVSAEPLAEGEAGQETEQTEISVFGRLGALFFVRVQGEAQEAGALEKFEQNEQGVFSLVFRNQGNVHLNPYGIIEIRDMFGRQTAQIEIDPYYVLPNSLRQREITWQGKGLGRYTAKLLLNRGYGDVIDQAEISFWLFQWQHLVIIGAAIIVLIKTLILLLCIRQRKKSQ